MHDLEERLSYKSEMSDSIFAFKVLRALLYYSWRNKSDKSIYTSIPLDTIKVISDICPEVENITWLEDDELDILEPEAEKFINSLGYSKYDKLMLAGRF